MYYSGLAEENHTGVQKYISISHFLEFPQVEVVPPVVSQMAGSDVIVACSASGSPAPVLFWNLNTTDHPPLSTTHEVPKKQTNKKTPHIPKLLTVFLYSAVEISNLIG